MSLRPNERNKPRSPFGAGARSVLGEGELAPLGRSAFLGIEAFKHRPVHVFHPVCPLTSQSFQRYGHPPEEDDDPLRLFPITEAEAYPGKDRVNLGCRRFLANHRNTNSFKGLLLSGVRHR